MGSGYLGSYRHTHGTSDKPDPNSNIDDNARLLARKYRLTSGGYFGQKGNAKVFASSAAPVQPTSRNTASSS